MNEDARDNFEEDDFQEAVARFKKMVKSHTSKYFDVYEVEGIVDHFLEDGRIKLAKKAVEAGLRLHPSSVSIKIRKAQVLLHEGKLEECLELLELAEQIETNNPDLYLTKGGALNLLGDVEKAVEAFDMALSMPIDHPDETLYNIGISFGQAGEGRGLSADRLRGLPRLHRSVPACRDLHDRRPHLDRKSVV